MSKGFGKKSLSVPPTRRLCRIVTDERGKTSSEWFDAPPDHPCPTVELKRLDAGLSLTPDKTDEPEVAYDPYSNSADGTRKRATRKRTDLRQLSEWIKRNREMKQPDVASEDE